MIVVQLIGGLGNQMFQYALGRKLANKLGTQLKLDKTRYENIPAGETPRHYELGCFKLEAEFASLSEIPPVPQEGLKGRLKALARPQKLARVTEKGHNFHPEILEIADNSYLSGYWQSEKYFADIRAEILEDFTLKTPLSGKNATTAKKIEADNSVALHVRRGDYVTNKDAAKFHGLSPLEYYTAAVKLVSEKLKDPHFYVFSDDPEWCKQNLKLGANSTFVDHNPPDTKGFEDLRLMFMCKHNIVANSSFSWWGAWLNQNPEKMVIAPERWFTDPNTDTSDVVPKDWIKL